METRWRYQRYAAATPLSQGLCSKKIEKARRRNRLITLAMDLVITVVVVWLVFGLVLGLGVVRGDSMLPNYQNGDLVLISRGHSASVGDVILFRCDGMEYIKRVIAGPGDKVELDEQTGEVLVNGSPSQEDICIISPTLARKGGLTFPLTVGEGQLFVLGDNRPYSQDSREIGLISLEQVDGKVLAQLRLAIS